MPALLASIPSLEFDPTRLERRVIQCFRQLSWSYYRNTPLTFGTDIIINGLLNVYGKGSARYLHLNYTATDELDELAKLFHVMDGRAEPDRFQSMWKCLSEALHMRQSLWEGEYFSVRWYRMGSGHIVFKRMDLVERLNAILVKHYPDALSPEVQ